MFLRTRESDSTNARDQHKRKMVRNIPPVGGLVTDKQDGVVRMLYISHDTGNDYSNHFQDP